MWGKEGVSWFALVEWQAHIHDYRVDGADHHGMIFCTAWVATEHVARLEGGDYTGTPRVTLYGDPQAWPTRLRPGVTSPPADFYFGLLDGGPLVAPPGVKWFEGHGSAYG
jgi:hypothetical protein